MPSAGRNHRNAFLPDPHQASAAASVSLATQTCFLRGSNLQVGNQSLVQPALGSNKADREGKEHRQSKSEGQAKNRGQNILTTI